MTKPEEWARILKEEWEQRAASPHRDFYVASHERWDDAAAWRQQAETDVRWYFHEVSSGRLAASHVLEVGCGVGRLATAIRARARSYSGFDVSAGMVREARRRCADLVDVRFAVSDGLGVPSELTDREYGFVIAPAVLIHCPEEVIGPLVRSAFGSLAPGGELRLQLRADASDATGLASPEGASAAHEQIEASERLGRDVGPELLDDSHYMPASFRWDGARRLLEEATGREPFLVRLDLASIYAVVTA